ncbi:MAG: response regulator [Planctomycetota bacterium]|nr:response regulator [Planctomycetota bacterium]
MLDVLRNLVAPRHIVIIDDDANILRILRDILEKKKYHVTTASSWATLGDVVALNEQREISLFLLDIFLDTEPNGVEIAKILREKGFVCPICFISGKPCSIEEEQRLTSCFPNTYFLAKPISPTALLAKVAALT